MELRSGRSRSNTPFLTNNLDKDLVLTGNHVEKVTKTRNTTINYENIVSTESKRVKSKSKRSQRGVYRTSDYSSEDGEHDIFSPVRHISDNLKNQLREEALHFGNAVDDVSALKVYKEAGDYWNKYPKTDYTYSKHSKDRLEIAPGVIAMPNMSRRSLRSYSSQGGYTQNKQTNTDSYFEDESIDYTTTTNGSSFRHRYTSSDHKQGEEEEEEEYVIIKRRSTQRTLIQRTFQVIVTIFTTIFYPVYYVYDKQHSLIIWFAKTLHKIASRMMLIDTWLLQGSSSERKISTIVGLCLFPLLFFGGWWLMCGLGQLLQGNLLDTTTIPLQISMVSQILTPWKTESKSEQIRNSEMSDDQNNVINELKTKIDVMQSELLSKQSNDDRFDMDVIDQLKGKIDRIQKDVALFEQNRKKDMTKIMSEINQYHKKSLVHVEHYVLQFLKELFGAPNNVVTQNDFSKWIKLIFVAHQDLEMRLDNLTQSLKGDFLYIVSNNEQLLMDKVIAKILEFSAQLIKPTGGSVSTINFSDEHIKKLVGEALAVYDADKTGLVDFALESSGGHIISTRCTESYQVKTAILSIFGIPIYYPTNSPRTAITPGVNPGECWAFQSFPGFLVVKLSGRIVVEAFSVEHISKRLSATGKIDSALKKFEVYALVNETDHDPILLGSYEYREDGKPLQYFEVQKRGHTCDMIELRILSNHGNPNYTCLYRFRVHGTLSQEPT